MLDEVGQVYSLGDNNHFQVNAGEKNKGGKEGEGQAGTVKPEEESSRTREAGQGFFKEPQRVYFGSRDSKSIYKLHAFGDTSLALSRAGDIYLWGLNSMSTLESSFGCNYRRPELINDICGVKLSQVRANLLSDQAPDTGEDKGAKSEPGLSLLNEIRVMNDFEITKIIPQIGEIKNKIKENDVLVKNKTDQIKAMEARIKDLEENTLGAGTNDKEIDQLAEMNDVL